MEQKTKHTPGPWHLIRDYEKEQNLSPYEPNKVRYMGVQMNNAGGFIINKNANPHANSCLIAAAPDMLEALQAAAEFLDWVVDNVNKMAHAHEELGQNLEETEGWKAFESAVGDGFFACHENQFHAALEKAEGKDA